MSKRMVKRCQRCGEQDRSPGIPHVCPELTRITPQQQTPRSILLTCRWCQADVWLPKSRISRCVTSGRLFARGLCDQCRRPINREVVGVIVKDHH